jgi:hypothetical protein
MTDQVCCEAGFHRWRPESRSIIKGSFNRGDTAQAFRHERRFGSTATPPSFLRGCFLGMPVPVGLRLSLATQVSSVILRPREGSRPLATA